MSDSKTISQNDLNVALLIQKLDSKIDNLSSEFHSELEKVHSELEKVQTKLFMRITTVLSTVIVFAVSVAFFVMFWIFDYKFEFTNAQYQAHFEKLDSAVFIPQSQAILQEMRELNRQHKNKPKK